MKRNNVIQWLIVIILISLIIFGVYKIFKHFIIIYEELEYAKIFVIDKAEEDLGENCRVVTGKYNSQDKSYQIGCISEKGDHAIIYRVKPSVNKKEWFVRQLSSRIGGDAESLFDVPHIIGKQR